jgi:putative hydrolase of the HAD superfamily
MRRAVVSDFGGVLTSPLMGAFLAVQEADGIPLEALGRALATVAERDGANPLFELETGRLTWADFVVRLGAALSDDLGREVRMDGFAERLFAALHPNEELFAYFRELRGRGVRLALCTNNVREWEPRWRTLLPIDELFEVVVDSGFVGIRKPDPGIYELTLERLGLRGEEVVFVDDLEHNVEAARALGMAGVVFTSTPQARGEIEAALAG